MSEFAISHKNNLRESDKASSYDSKLPFLKKRTHIIKLQSICRCLCLLKE